MKIPDGYRVCGCGTLTKAQACRSCGEKRATMPGKAPSPAPLVRTSPTPPKGKGGAKAPGAGPNKTEAEYRRTFIDRIPGAVASYEGITFRMANGHRYTPDWIVRHQGGAIECVEVKGAHRFGSHQRARLAFDQARIEWPTFRWTWATLTKAGWKVSGD